MLSTGGIDMRTNNAFHVKFRYKFKKPKWQKICIPANYPQIVGVLLFYYETFVKGNCDNNVEKNMKVEF